MSYGYTGPSGPVPRKPEGATTVFILGLLGLLICGILGIFAWIQGNDYVNRCQAAGVEPDGLAVAGRIMGIIATGLMVLGFAIAALMVVLGGLASVAH
jgi:hypothetical protein